MVFVKDCVEPFYFICSSLIPQIILYDRTVIGLFVILAELGIIVPVFFIIIDISDPLCAECIYTGSDTAVACEGTHRIGCCLIDDLSGITYCLNVCDIICRRVQGGIRSNQT